MSKHTSGPWFEIGGKQVMAQFNKITGRGTKNETVAYCDYAWMTVEEREANARLIAAAPELLAALENIVAWMEQHHPEAAKNIPQARAAIAKVRGNTN
jgi:hypothetical protein